ncbi:MAG TPA: 3-hydroxyacyl-ACP dehydratase FabZ [Rhizomicrobium sp.]|jgi:3-hydroxyacyl-[acyl-carrier-protein] dehydratase|nr:3-hydroxyacyl-ACP dehydratase FabZ [Rhizomicrobium sp.]
MSEGAKTVLGVEELKRLLPHRAPFLFVERLTDIVPFESANGFKAVSYNEPHFQGHFPQYSVMPGVLIVEALAQTAGALVVHSMAVKEPPLVFFMGIDKARFRKPVVPGDLLRLFVKAVHHRGPVWKFEGKAYVGETLSAEAEFSAMIRNDTPG